MHPSPDTHTVADVIRALELQPLGAEGGFFRRTAESASYIETPWGRRRTWSMIEALFTLEDFSALHRLRQDEVWNFLAGDPLELVQLNPERGGSRCILGKGDAGGRRVESVVLARTWQGARLLPGGRWSLVSCMVAPEYQQEDFELGDRAALTAAYPGFADIIEALTRPR